MHLIINMSTYSFWVINIYKILKIIVPNNGFTSDIK